MGVILRYPIAAAFIEHEASIEADCVPLDPIAEALETARRALGRALSCESSMLRIDYLYRTRDALHAAGERAWADLAEAAAVRIGGSDQGIERLLFEVDCTISRREHSL